MFHFIKKKNFFFKAVFFFFLAGPHSCCLGCAATIFPEEAPKPTLLRSLLGQLRAYSCGDCVALILSEGHVGSMVTEGRELMNSTFRHFRNGAGRGGLGDGRRRDGAGT